ncbi:hypothetical protein FACS1894187_11550 [Synergistales bacterium]|nr:hypothetical protein FACS1894187_11550 [Synergistales bacterium]
MDTKIYEKQELAELLKKYTPKGFTMIEGSQSVASRKISIVSIEICGYAGFEDKVFVDFSGLRGLVALQGDNGCGKTSLFQAIEQCLCDEPKKFNKNTRAKHHKLTLVYRDNQVEHTVVCTPDKKTRDGKAVEPKIIESVQLNLALADLTSKATKATTEYNTKVLDLASLNSYFDLTDARLGELEAKSEAITRELNEYDKRCTVYREETDRYNRNIAMAKEEEATYGVRVKDWQTEADRIKESNAAQLKEHEAACAVIDKNNAEAEAGYQLALAKFNTQFDALRDQYAKYANDQNALILEKEDELAKLEGTEGGSEKGLNESVKKVKASITELLSAEEEKAEALEAQRLEALELHLASSVFSEKDKEIIEADYVNGKKRLETKLKNAKKLSIGECPTCLTDITEEMKQDLISKYENSVAEMESMSKEQARLKSKDARERAKYVWERDGELTAVRENIAAYTEALELKDADYRKKGGADIKIDVLRTLYGLYGQIFTIKSLRTKNAGEIKALKASIKQLKGDVMGEDAYIAKNATLSAPAEPVKMRYPQQPTPAAEPEKPKKIELSSIVAPVAPKQPEGLSTMSAVLSEMSLCKEISRQKSVVIARITKLYFDALKPRIEEVSKRLRLNLSVEISKNQSIGYTYNGVKINSFSGGEQTIVNIAVALAHSYLESDILFIDEKLDTLDKGNFTEVRGILRKALAELGIRAIVVISHRDMPDMDGRLQLRA